MENLLMVKDLVKSYLSIFRLSAEECKIIGVKKTSRTGKGRSFKLELLVKTKTNFENISGNQFACDIFRKKLKGREIAGVDLIKKVKMKNDKEKRARFVYSTHLIPENILAFVIKDKQLYIRVLGFGILE